ncbi:MAG: TetR/AcrR family transcriptional regulator, partial [Mycobacterium sp.]
DPVVVRKRSESAALLAALLGQHGQQALGLPDDERLKATSQFVVGGVGQALTAWLTGQVALTQDELIDQLAWFIDRLSRQRG